MREYPVTVTQTLLQLYRKFPVAFKPIAMCHDFLYALASTLFQQRVTTADNSQNSTPTHLPASVNQHVSATIDIYLLGLCYIS